MLKETLNSVFDNIKERTTNPFLGTLLVVWVVKNWTLVYSLFYFDKSFKLEDRLKYIERYFINHSFIANMVFVILITLAVLVLTYILLSLSRLVTDIQERIVVPLISKWTDKSSIVLKSDYISLLEAMKIIEKRLDDERSAKVIALEQRDVAEQKLVQLSQENSKVLKQDSSINQQEISQNHEHDSDFRRVLNLVINQFTKEEIDATIDLLLRNYTIKDTDQLTALFLREGFITITNSSSSSAAYDFTDEGRKFLKYLNNNA